jgi:hypothetical protein
MIFWKFREIRTDDFIRPNDVFVVNDEFYLCTAVVHDAENVYGKGISTFETFPKEETFKFSEVQEIYLKNDN